MTGEVIHLSETCKTPLSAVGGKARGLGLLMRAGFEVPEGFVVTAEASLADADVDAHLARLGSGPFAVRSSGAEEDSPESSLAGRYQSILGVDGESVSKAISEVRNSARRATGESIAVLVQRMIDPVSAGVVFTADPVSGKRDKTIVTATRGLADRLLAGQVPGDEWEIGPRTARRVRSPEGVLSRRLARRVAKVAADIEREFEVPQDVEWAWDGERLWIVQARPITGLPDDLSWEPPAPGIYQRSLRFGEWIPEPVTPLFESWLLPRMERRLHDHLTELIGQIAPEPLHVIVNGWYYYSLNWLPVPGVAFTRNLINIVRRVRKDWRMAAPMFPATVRFGYQRCEADWRDNVLPSYRRAASRGKDLVETLSPVELVGLIDDLATEAGRYFASIATVAGSAYKFEEQLAMFWNKHLRKKLGISHMVVLQGFELPPEVYQTPRLETLDWAVAPAPSQEAGPPDIDELEISRSEAVRDAERALADSPRRLRKFRRLLAEAQHVVPVREEQLGLLSLPWPVMRRAVQRIGEALNDSGVVGSVDDVFYLTHGEVTSLLESPKPMSTVVARRRDERSQAARLAAPLWVGRVPRLVKIIFAYTSKVMGAVRSDSAILHGTPASPGRATGPVRVVRDSSRFAEFKDGEILVAPLTAPAWTHLFGRAAAVVTDVGSAFAHASIIAREYGIPAVVGCGDATSRLRDGQIVTVDGSTGNVELDFSGAEVSPAV